MTKFAAFAFLTVAIVFISFLDEASAQEKSCKSVVADLTKRQLSGISKCTKSLKFKNGKEKAAKSNCILKCVMINEGLLNADGTFDSDGVVKFIDKEFAEGSRKNVLKHFNICVEEAGSQIDPKEEYCKTYEPIIKCLTAKLSVICIE